MLKKLELPAAIALIVLFWLLAGTILSLPLKLWDFLRAALFPKAVPF